MCLDYDEDLLKFASDNYDGIVLSGYGAGHVMAKNMLCIKNIKKPIVMTSRCESGKTGLKTYGYAGAEIDLVKNGVIMSEYLSNVKARMLLSVLLSLDYQKEQIIKIFKEYN